MQSSSGLDFVARLVAGMGATLACWWSCKSGNGWAIGWRTFFFRSSQPYHWSLIDADMSARTVCAQSQRLLGRWPGFAAPWTSENEGADRQGA